MQALQIVIEFAEGRDDVKTAQLRAIERLEQELQALDINSRVQTNVLDRRAVHAGELRTASRFYYYNINSDQHASTQQPSIDSKRGPNGLGLTGLQTGPIFKPPRYCRRVRCPRINTSNSR
jgi:hypothetical protein